MNGTGIHVIAAAVLTVLTAAPQAPPATRSGYDRIIATAAREHDLLREAAARRGLGSLLRASDPVQAAAELQKALALFEQLHDDVGTAWTLNELGWMAFADARPEDADRFWLRGLALFEAVGHQRGRLELMHNRCFVLPAGPEKRALLEQGLALAREMGDVRIESQFLYKTGEQQMWDGDFAAALPTLEQAVEGFEKTHHPELAARVLIPLGRLHWLHGRPERALAIFQRAHDILVRSNEPDGAAQALSALASGYHALGDLTRALAVQRRAVALSLKVGMQRSVNLHRLQLARLLLDARQPRDAKALIDTVLSSGDSFARRVAQEPLSDTWAALGDPGQALDAINEAIRQTPERNARPAMLARRARLSDLLGRHDDALADVSAALDEIERMRPLLVQTDPMKLGFSERLQWVFDLAVRLRAKHGRAEAALDAAERGRARAFLDLLASRQLTVDTPGAELRSVATVAPSGPATITSAAARLHSTVVEYWVGEKETIVWVVGARGLVTSAVISSGASRLTALIRAAEASSRAFVTTVDGHLVRRSAPSAPFRTLYDLLIRPVASALPQSPGSLLTIVPHGPLSRLSFAALRDQRGRYLIERYALHYVPAGAVLEQTAAKEPAGAGTFLLVANPASPPTGDGGRVLPPLPGALQEIHGIRDLLPRRTAVELTGAAANEERVRVAAADSRVLHFATHAVLRDDQSLDSFLALGRGGRAEDGRLTAQEIYQLKLHADLVVLSACRTTAGPLTGDGIVGLARAFFYAGTPSLMATAWNLPDVSGARLMPLFYRAWIGGRGKAEALRDAQLALLSQLRAGRVTIDSPGGPVKLDEDPFLWAGYVLLGEPR